jgi:hypothetical protein
MESPAKSKSVKPANNSVVVEVEHMESLLGQLSCRQCGGAVKMTVKTVRIASSLGIEYLNEDCGFIFHSPAPAATTIHLARGDNLNERRITPSMFFMFLDSCRWVMVVLRLLDCWVCWVCWVSQMIQQ